MCKSQRIMRNLGKQQTRRIVDSDMLADQILRGNDATFLLRVNRKFLARSTGHETRAFFGTHNIGKSPASARMDCPVRKKSERKEPPGPSGTGRSVQLSIVPGAGKIISMDFAMTGPLVSAKS